LYRGDSDYLDTISNVDGQILFDTDKKEIFMDDGTTRESYGGGAGDKVYATKAEAIADLANISDTDTVFVKEGTSASLTQRVDDLETEVTEISSDLSDLGDCVELCSFTSTQSNVEVQSLSQFKYIMLAMDNTMSGNILNTTILPKSLFANGYKMTTTVTWNGAFYANEVDYVDDTHVNTFMINGVWGGRLYGIK
jgi:hypothetical protein